MDVKRSWTSSTPLTDEFVMRGWLKFIPQTSCETYYSQRFLIPQFSPERAMWSKSEVHKGEVYKCLVLQKISLCMLNTRFDDVLQESEHWWQFQHLYYTGSYSTREAKSSNGLLWTSRSTSQCDCSAYFKFLGFKSAMYENENDRVDQASQFSKLFLFLKLSNCCLMLKKSVEQMSSFISVIGKLIRRQIKALAQTGQNQK